MPPDRSHTWKEGKRLLARALGLFAVLLTSARAMAGDYRLLEGLRYTPPEWPAQLSGDLYLPERSGPRPVVLVVHGGSWKGGDRASFDATRIARPLAERGYAVFSVDYRLAPAARFPAPLADLQQAIAWLRANAATYQLDPDAVGAWGYSAGAHLVAMLGTTAGESLRLRAVVAGGLPADLTAWPDSSAVKTFLGKSAREDRALSAAASPINHVTAATPPFFLYHGATDTLVEPEQTQRFAATLATRGVVVDTLYLRHFGHVLTAVFPGKALEQGAAFLDRHMAPLPAKTVRASAEDGVEAGSEVGVVTEAGAKTGTRTGAEAGAGAGPNTRSSASATLPGTTSPPLEQAPGNAP